MEDDNLNGNSQFPSDSNEKAEGTIQNKRDVYTTEIKKKDKNLANNTEDQLMVLESNEGDQELSAVALKEYIKKVLLEEFTMEDFAKIAEAINSQDRFQQHYGVIGLRKLLSKDDPPIEDVINFNLGPRLILFLQNEKEPHLQIESTWALTNIVKSGIPTLTRKIIKNEDSILFVKLLSSPHADVVEKAMEGIGALAIESIHYRNIILQAEGLSLVMKIMECTTNKETRKQGVKTLASICENIIPKDGIVKNAIELLAPVIKDESDPDVLEHAAWTMASLADGRKPFIQLIVSTGVVPALLKHLTHSSSSVVYPCLWILRCVLTETKDQRNLIVRYPGIADLFLGFLYKNLSTKRETLLILADIAAGTPDEIGVLLRCPELAKGLCQLALKDFLEMRRLSTRVLANIAHYGNFEQTRLLVDNQVVGLMCEQLEIKDSELTTPALECIINIVRHGIKHIEELNVANPAFNHIVSVRVRGTKKIEKFKKRWTYSREARRAIISLIRAIYDSNDPFKSLGIDIGE